MATDEITNVIDLGVGIWQSLGVNFYFHCMRHNFTTELGRLGFPAELIRQIVGWESVEMVSVYDDRDVDDLLEDFVNKLEVAI